MRFGSKRNPVEIVVKIESVTPTHLTSLVYGEVSEKAFNVVNVSYYAPNSIVRNAYTILAPANETSSWLAMDIYGLLHGLSANHDGDYDYEDWLLFESDKALIANGFKLLIINECDQINFDLFAEKLKEHLACENLVLIQTAEAA